MFVSPLILNCVCFVCSYENDEYRPAGTAFFMGIAAEGTDPQRYSAVVITALHVIAEIERSGKRIFLRVNTHGGGFDYVEMPFDQWVRSDHSDGIVDAAACFFPHNNQVKFDYMFVADEQAATTEELRTLRIGVGNEVYLAGLFVNHVGSGRNEPIIRSGFIASIPEEEVLTNHGRMRAYLIESRSIGGLSGSPVFVDAGLWYHDDTGELHMRPTQTRAWHLIGIIRGHWDAPDEVGPNSGRLNERINMGIAIVTPIEAVIPLAREAVAQANANWQRQVIDGIREAGAQLLSLLAQTARTNSDGNDAEGETEK